MTPIFSRLPISLAKSGVLIDVDGTLINANREITPRTAQAIKTAFDHKIQLGLCTGRQFAQLARYVMSYFAPTALHVVSGGGQIVTSLGGVLWSKNLSSDVVFTLCQAANKYGCGFGFGVGAMYYTNEPLLKRFGNDLWKIETSDTTGLKDWSASLLVITPTNPEMLAVLAQTPGLEVKYMIDRNHQPYADVTAAGVNKGVAVKVWAQLQGLELENCIGLGDSDNDQEFLTAVGWGVAMGNANDRIKAIADQVIGRADEEGVALFLEQLINTTS